jgi:hypothetical protein
MQTLSSALVETLKILMLLICPTLALLILKLLRPSALRNKHVHVPLRTNRANHKKR